MSAFISSESIFDQPWLTHLWLEITTKCNLSCHHCYLSSNPHEPLYGLMNNQNWLDTIEAAAKIGCKSIQFIGGEPTLHPALPIMLSHARNCGIEFIEIYTNGTSLTEKRLNVFCEYQASLAVSFYSVNAEIHDDIVEKNGSHRRTIQGIEAVLRKKIPLRVGFIETPKNVGHFEQARNFLINIGVDEQKIGFDKARGFGRASEFKAQSYNSSFGDLCGQCWKGRLCISSNGSAFPCVMSRSYVIGNVIEEGGVEQVLRNKALNDFRSNMATEYGVITQPSQLMSNDRSTTVPEPIEPIRRCPPGQCGPDKPAPPCHPDEPRELCEPDFNYCEPGDPKSKNPSWSNRNPPVGRINDNPGEIIKVSEA
jgi:MoaA/NifB/PqqE/SkfB family radical SAM enzyme